ncbi:hypothetical protein DY023_01980 [Microbacterium bovistercoris]|uniref:O-antigen ligase-related domain-containing protein n=1 Tax=Microbacterium bovistercoris TaxID=2293570 RepID=A0A371NYR9_9MICO|nr:hypothetical protein DY023_01980 [Microbacterium bovistercoris]
MTTSALSAPAPSTSGWAARIPAPVLVPAGHSARIIDALLGMLLIYRIAVPGVPLPIPQLAAIVLIGVALFRRPTRSFATAWWYPLMTPLLLLFLVVETWANGLAPERRAGNLAVLMLFAAFLASGRIDIGSVLKGLGFALALNAVLFYVGVAPDDYEGKLTGYLQDKNAAALVYAVVAVLLLFVVRRTWLHVLILIGGAAAIVATDSRTTMAAFAISLLFLFGSRWLRRGFQIVLLLGCVLLFLWADANLSTWGDYSVTREGSDEFRMRIDTASSLKAQAAPWYGNGLGQATVNLDSGTWFFHNSYEALVVEGGLVLLVVVLAMYAITGLGLSTRVQVDVLTLQSRSITAATLIIFLCATRLGEVFFAPIGFLVLGIGLARLLAPIKSPTMN